MCFPDVCGKVCDRTSQAALKILSPKTKHVAPNGWCWWGSHHKAQSTSCKQLPRTGPSSFSGAFKWPQLHCECIPPETFKPPSSAAPSCWQKWCEIMVLFFQTAVFGGDSFCRNGKLSLDVWPWTWERKLVSKRESCDCCWERQSNISLEPGRKHLDSSLIFL